MENTIQIIINHLQTISQSDQQVKKALEDMTINDKTFDAMWDYIYQKAKIELQGKNGALSQDVVYSWAVHYITESNDVIEDEIPKSRISEHIQKTDISNIESSEPVNKKNQPKKQLIPSGYVQLSMFGDDNVL